MMGRFVDTISLLIGRARLRATKVRGGWRFQCALWPELAALFDGDDDAVPAIEEFSRLAALLKSGVRDAPRRTMSDHIDCPFCSAPYGVGEPIFENQTVEAECRNCGHSFEITASLSVSYRASCLDADHVWTIVRFQIEQCARCEKMRSVPVKVMVPK